MLYISNIITKEGQKPLLPIPIIDKTVEDKYLFVKFEKDVGDLAMENGQSITVDQGDFLFVPFKTVKVLIAQGVCLAV